jgi:hypothetical protein
VDIELSIEEGNAVSTAYDDMDGFTCRHYYTIATEDPVENSIFNNFYKALEFSSSPAVKPEHERSTHKVLAVTQVYCVTFNQGVNEMQTFANMSSGRDVARQTDINNHSLARLRYICCVYDKTMSYA